MQAGSVTDQPMVELLCSLAAQNASGKLVVAEGKKKRSFFFERGELRLTRSNLKSESFAQLKKRYPAEDKDGLIKLQSTIRILKVVALEEGTWEFVPNEAPPDRRPTSLLESVWQALTTKISPDVIAARLEPFEQHFPRVARSAGVPMDSMPVPDGIRGMLRDLDGQRRLDDILEFAPGSIREARAAMYLALICRAVEFEQWGVFSEVRAVSEDEVRDNSSVVESSAPLESVRLPVSAEDATHVLTPEAMQALREEALADDDPPPEEAEPAVSDLDIPEDPEETLPTSEMVIEEDDGDATDMQALTDMEGMRLRRELKRINETENHFGVLGVHWDVSYSDMRKAYFAAAQEFHPDRWAGRSQDLLHLAQEVFAAYTEAWGVLGEDDRRKAYTDKVIHGKKSEEELAMEKVREIMAAESDFKLGQSHFHRGRIVQAHAQFQLAYERVPEEPEFIAWYGYSTWKVNTPKNPEAAREGELMLQKALEMGNRLDAGWYLQGLIWKGKGKFNQAAQCYVKALEMNPQNGEAERELKRLSQERERIRARAAQKESKKKSGGFLGGLFNRKK